MSPIHTIGSILLLLMILTASSAQTPADQPLEREDENSKLAHQELIDKTRKGRIDVYFVGDSITRRWGATDYPKFLENWQRNFHGWNAANFGWGGDRTQNILWRLQNGELENTDPKVFVILAGTNNIHANATTEDAIDIARGILAIGDLCKAHSPHASIVIMGVFPRSDLKNATQVIDMINEHVQEACAVKSFRYLNINQQLLNEAGQLKEGYFPDKLHLDLPAYQVWADNLKPILHEILGSPADSDEAPPPTGDPKARKK